jgi:predicted transcriptional regulator
LGDRELRVFRYVADNAPVAVSEAAEHFGDRDGLARTTVLTMMERLRGKGYLRRRKGEGVYRYSPTVTKKDLLRSLVQDFAERFLGGSPQPFVAYLAEDADLAEEDVEQLEHLLRELGNRRRRRRR